MVTIKDIATHCSVSLSTVCGILNGRKDFAEETIKRVWTTANELGYKVSQEARCLRSKVSGQRAPSKILLHVSYRGPQTLPENDFFEMQRSMLLTVAAAKREYYITDHFYNRDEGFHCYPYLSDHFDGAIIGSPHSEVIETLVKKLPIVMMDIPKLTGTTGAPAVNMDFFSGIMSMFEELQKRNHTQLAVIYSSSPNTLWLEERLIGFVDMLYSRYGLRIANNARFDIKDLTEVNHYEKMKSLASELIPKLRKGEINGIIAMNYRVMETLHSFISISGMNPETYSEVSLNTPHPGIYSFDSICYDWPRLTDKAVELLTTQLNNKNTTDYNFECLIPPQMDIITSKEKERRKNICFTKLLS